MHFSYRILLFLFLVSGFGLQGQDQPSWYAAFDDFQWINEAPEQMHPSLIHLTNFDIKHELVVVPDTGHGINWSIENTDTRINNFITNSLEHFSNH